LWEKRGLGIKVVYEVFVLRKHKKASWNPWVPERARVQLT